MAALVRVGSARDRRFPAARTSASPRPSGRDNPIYRTLKELYLLASDWLLRQASEAEDLSPGGAAAPGFSPPSVR